MDETRAYSAAGANSPRALSTIPWRDPAGHDVQIEVLFSGICHSDIHSVRNEWSEFMPTVYPIVPGHEIVGRVARVGPEVTKFTPGNLAAIGCLDIANDTLSRDSAIRSLIVALLYTVGGRRVHRGPTAVFSTAKASSVR